MKIAIMQPTYLPWIGYFDLIRSVDAFVIYDHAQFEKQSWQNRNKIRSKNGEILLSLQLDNRGTSFRPIKDVQLFQPAFFLKSHFKSIQLSYAKAKNYEEIIGELKVLFEQPYTSLMELNMAFILYGMKKLGLSTNILFSSEMNTQGKRVELLVDVCKKCGANQYLSPVGSKDYIDENNIFDENGIELIYQNYRHPVYQQVNYKDFISHLSFIDYLMNNSSLDF